LDIPNQAKEKTPFNWFFGLSAKLNSLTATSTDNFVNLAFNLHQLGIGSTTSMGNILPDVTVFSKSTILTYIPAPLWASFQLFMSSILFFYFARWLYNEAGFLAMNIRDHRNL